MARQPAAATVSRSAHRHRPPEPDRGEVRSRRAAAATAKVIAVVVAIAYVAIGLAVHLPHAILRGPTVADVAGVLLGLAGIALIVFVARLAFRGRRRRTKLLAIGIALVAAQWIVLPIVGAGLAVNAPDPRAPAASALHLPGARDVVFPARDGARLAGWYVPGRNGAAVVLLHGSHGSRADTVDHLRMLARAGYGVLAYDARGHGASAGQTNALGWRGADDVAGAVAFLRRQPGVDPRRIAALGLSMGAEEALRAAAGGVALRAVVADGAGASTAGDERIVSDGPIARSVTWMTMRATELLSGDAEPAPLEDVAHAIRVPVLLVASRRAGERRIDEAYRSRIASARLWYVADADHTEALRAHPRAYAARVLGFLDAALGSSRAVS
jgi:pimeloyl-ACP methyl ester carboxylesterase